MVLRRGVEADARWECVAMPVSVDELRRWAADLVEDVPRDQRSREELSRLLLEAADDVDALRVFVVGSVLAKEG